MNQEVETSLEELLKNVLEELNYRRATLRVIVGDRVYTLAAYGLREDIARNEKNEDGFLVENTIARYYSGWEPFLEEICLDDAHQRRLVKRKRRVPQREGTIRNEGEIWGILFREIKDEYENAIKKERYPEYCEECKKNGKTPLSVGEWYAEIQRSDFSYDRESASDPQFREKYPTYTIYMKDARSIAFTQSSLARYMKSIISLLRTNSGVRVLFDADYSRELGSDLKPAEPEKLEAIKQEIERNIHPFLLLTGIHFAGKQHPDDATRRMFQETAQSCLDEVIEKDREETVIFHYQTPSKNEIYVTQLNERYGKLFRALIVKRFKDPKRVEASVRVSEELSRNEKIKVPAVVGFTDRYLICEVIPGASLFDLLEDLSRKKKSRAFAEPIRTALLEKGLEDLMYAQSHAAQSLEKRASGHKEKLYQTLQWCAEAFKIRVDDDLLQIVREDLGSLLEANATVPFFDRSPRNLRVDYRGVIQDLELRLPKRLQKCLDLTIPDLSLTQISEINPMLFAALKNGSINLKEVIQTFRRNLYEIDFDDAFLLTTPYDDVCELLQSPFSGSDMEKGITIENPKLWQATRLYRHLRYVMHYNEWSAHAELLSGRRYHAMMAYHFSEASKTLQELCGMRPEKWHVVKEIHRERFVPEDKRMRGYMEKFFGLLSRYVTKVEAKGGSE